MSKSPLTPVELAAIERTAQEAASGTYYGLLGLDQSAGPEDVETAYRDYVRDWHPDRFFSRDPGEHLGTIEDNFVHVTRAYKTLRDRKKRPTYDADLSSRGVTVAQVAGVARDERVGFEVRLERGPAGAKVAVSDSRVADSRTAAAPSSTIQMATRMGSAAPAPLPASEVVPPGVRGVSNPAVDRLKSQVVEQLARAQGYYDAGLADFEQGRFSKAESALYLAMRYDPRNPQYAELFKKAQAKARSQRAVVINAQAQQAEQFGNIKEAMALYRRAVECEPDDGAAAARLAHLIRQTEEDHREAVALLRKAIQKEPRKADYRVSLAELYVELKLDQNALREAQAATEADPKHERARALYRQLRATAR